MPAHMILLCHQHAGCLLECRACHRNSSRSARQASESCIIADCCSIVLSSCCHHCPLQAVEFWSTVCDTEIDLDEEDDDSMPNHKFIEAAAPQLVPVLLEQLTKQESDEPDSDESSWNMAMASGTCLGLMARACRDAIVPLVLPFVNTNITRSAAAEDWHLREAATFAFGSIMDGPSPDSLKQWVQQGLVYLLQALGTVSRQQAQLPLMMMSPVLLHAC